MDCFAQGLRSRAIRKDGLLTDIVKKRYGLVGRRHPAPRSKRQARLREPRGVLLKKGDAEKNVSGRQEMIENIINRYIK